MMKRWTSDCVYMNKVTNVLDFPAQLTLLEENSCKRITDSLTFLLTLPTLHSWPSMAGPSTLSLVLCQEVTWRPATTRVPSGPVTTVVCVTPTVHPTPAGVL